MATSQPALDSEPTTPLAISFAERRKWLEDLGKFMHARNTPLVKIPKVGGVILDLYRLFMEVRRRGGLRSVSSNKQWKEIINAFNFPASCTSASFTLREHYTKYLFPYEEYLNKIAEGIDPEIEIPSQLSPSAAEAINKLANAELLIGCCASCGNRAKKKCEHGRCKACSTRTASCCDTPDGMKSWSSPAAKKTKLPSDSVEDADGKTGCNSDVVGRNMPDLAGHSVTGIVESRCDFGYFLSVRVGDVDFSGVLVMPQPNAAQTVASAAAAAHMAGPSMCTDSATATAAASPSTVKMEPSSAGLLGPGGLAALDRPRYGAPSKVDWPQVMGMGMGVVTNVVPLPAGAGPVVNLAKAEQKGVMPVDCHRPSMLPLCTSQLLHFSAPPIGT